VTKTTFIKGGTVVQGQSVSKKDLLISGEQISEIGFSYAEFMSALKGK